MEIPGMMCWFDKFQERSLRGSMLASVMPGHHKIERAATSEQTGEPCLYLNSGNEDVMDCSKMMLSPSGIARGYSTDVTSGYRRVPFDGGAAMAMSPSPARVEGKQ